MYKLLTSFPTTALFSDSVRNLSFRETEVCCKSLPISGQSCDSTPTLTTKSMDLAVLTTNTLQFSREEKQLELKGAFARGRSVSSCGEGQSSLGFPLYSVLGYFLYFLKKSISCLIYGKLGMLEWISAQALELGSFQCTIVLSQFLETYRKCFRLHLIVFLQSLLSENF